MGTEEPEISRRRERLATLGVVVLAVITVVLVVIALEHTSKASARATSSHPAAGEARPHVPAASSIWVGDVLVAATAEPGSYGGTTPAVRRGLDACPT